MGPLVRVPGSEHQQVIYSQALVFSSTQIGTIELLNRGIMMIQELTYAKCLVQYLTSWGKC